MALIIKVSFYVKNHELQCKITLLIKNMNNLPPCLSSETSAYDDLMKDFILCLYL